MDEFTTTLKAACTTLPYDSITVEPAGKNTLRIVIPAKYRVSHEEHFGQVTAKYLEYLKAGKMPDWEVPGMITKYFTTTSGLKMAKEGNR